MFDQAKLGKRIQGRRKVQGLTQEQLGHELGVSNQAVSKWEVGESTPDIALLPELCKLLGTSADVLLGIESDIGVETLGEELAKKIGRLKGEARDEAAMHVMWQLQVAADPASGWTDPGTGVNVVYRSVNGRFVNVRIFTQSGLVLVASKGVLVDFEPHPEAVNALRALLAPGAWDVAQSLLTGPKKEDALVDAHGGQAAQVRAALDALMEAGLVVQDRSGYRFDGLRKIAFAALIKVLCGVLGEPAAGGLSGLHESHYADEER